MGSFQSLIACYYFYYFRGNFLCSFAELGQAPVVASFFLVSLAECLSVNKNRGDPLVAGFLFAVLIILSTRSTLVVRGRQHHKPPYRRKSIHASQRPRADHPQAKELQSKLFRMVLSVGASQLITINKSYFFLHNYIRHLRYRPIFDQRSIFLCLCGYTYYF